MTPFNGHAGYWSVYMHNKPSKDMRRLISVLIVVVIILSSCTANKSYYQTREGKRKQKYYNAINLGQKNVPKPKF
jgi:hypothetical protein